MIIYHPMTDGMRTEFQQQDLSELAENAQAELLMIFTVLELIEKKQTLIPMTTFTTFDFNAIADPIDSYHDYDDPPLGWIFDFLHSDCQGVCDEIITLNKMHINTELVLPQVLHDLMDIKDYTKDEDGIYLAAQYFASAISDYQKVIAAQRFEPKWNNDIKRMDYTMTLSMKDLNSKLLFPLLCYSPHAVSLEWKYNAAKAATFRIILEAALSKTDWGKQTESFMRYLSSVHPIGNKVFIPFTTLGNKDFNVVHTLWHLQFNEDIKLLSWTGKDAWEVELKSNRMFSVFNPQLIGIQTQKEVSGVVKIEYDKKGQRLRINGITVPVAQSEYQCHLLEVLCDEKPIDDDLGFTEIGRIINHNATIEDDLTLRARYCNAANQLRIKIAAETGVKEIFKTSRQLIRFNPKYTFEFGLS